MSTHSKRQELINQANSWANWSFAGLLFPAGGWFAGIKSLMKLSKLTPKTNEEIRLFQNIRTKAWWALVLSTLTFIIVVWVRIDNYQQAEREATEASQQADEAKKTEEAQQEQAAASRATQQLLLNNCLEGIDKWYRENSTGLNTDSYWDRLLELRKQYTTECNAKYPVQ
ncbi:hypothetical protein HYS01_02770 [Candidatus Saccharibacteria bacterium]|nr:hypothetical protein [Candidatus Saccharibacteria bacterium]